MSVTVVIPTTRPTVDDLISSLEKGSQKPDDIVVVSNEYRPKRHCLLVGFDSAIQPYGWGDAGLRRDIGADVAETDLLLFIDDDCLAPKDLVESAVGIIERDGFCWGHHRYIDFDAHSKTELLSLAPEQGRSRENYVNNWHGWQSSYAGNFGIRRDLFWEVGGFDLAYVGHHGSEDQQLGYRLSKTNDHRTFVHEPPFAWHPTSARAHARPVSNITGAHRMARQTINGFDFAVCEECPSREPLDISGMTTQEKVVVPYSREQFTLTKERI